jgi:hypothetical protein
VRCDTWIPRADLKQRPDGARILNTTQREGDTVHYVDTSAVPKNTQFEQKFVEMTTLKNIFAMQLRLNLEAKNGRRYIILKSKNWFLTFYIYY